MELYEREFFLSEILFGSKMIKINEDTTIYLNPLTIEQNVYAQRVFKRAYDEALLSGVYTRKEMLEILEEQGVWTKKEEDLLKKGVKQIEDLKLSIYENFLRPSKRESSRKELRELEKQQMALLEKKSSSNHLDCQGIATYARLNWIIENTTTYKDGTPYSFEELDITKVLKYSNNDNFDNSDYREIARKEPWRSLWVNSNKDAEKVFRKPAFELTQEQSNLLSWTRLYDNVSEAHESPSDDIVEDDDALDGWLIKQRRERDKERSQTKLAGIEGSHNNAEEVFVMTHSKEEAEEIDVLNDPRGKWVKQSRMKALKEATDEGKDGIKYENFPDVRQKIMNEASKKFG